ncbi:hypothetical protein PM082_013693 [Marasmius tenuissimus]|nr:hypothetical protein PM082_013693 [Marasmius tenuissimus]
MLLRPDEVAKAFSVVVTVINNVIQAVPTRAHQKLEGFPPRLSYSRHQKGARLQSATWPDILGPQFPSCSVMELCCGRMRAGGRWRVTCWMGNRVDKYGLEPFETSEDNSRYPKE